jgi:hypothetical protein
VIAEEPVKVPATRAEHVAVRTSSLPAAARERRRSFASIALSVGAAGEHYVAMRLNNARRGYGVGACR